MKKVLSIFLVIFMIFCACSCTAGNNEETTENSSENEAYPVVTLKTETSTVKAGDNVQIVVNICNAKYTACFDIYVLADEPLVYKENEISAHGMIMAANYQDDDAEGRLAIRGIAAETVKLEDADICTVTYTVSEDAVSGDVINLMLQVPSYQIGLDESGNDVLDVEASVVLNNLVLRVE